MRYLIWGLLLITQNAAFTLVSRARNSKSLIYHAWASVLSNGIWFVSQLILVGSFVSVIERAAWLEAVGVGLFYTACTMIGSLGMHWLALRHIEKGE